MKFVFFETLKFVLFETLVCCVKQFIFCYEDFNMLMMYGYEIIKKRFKCFCDIDII